MHRHRDIIAECMVVQHIDAEEQDNIDQPPSNRDLVLFEEEGRTCSVKLRWEANDRHEEELDKREEGSCSQYTGSVSAQGVWRQDHAISAASEPAVTMQRHGRHDHQEINIPLPGSTLMIDSSAKTLEQQPPKIKESMAPMASHCGIVSINMRPARAMARLKTGRSSSIPYISAFSSEGAALITRGDGADTTEAFSPRSLLLPTLCCCLCSA